MFDKILVPLDGSRHSLRALQIAVQIAKKFNSKITLIHVYSVDVGSMVLAEPATLTPPHLSLMSATDFSKLIESARKRATEILEEGKRVVKDEEVEVEILLKEGHNVKEILKVVRDGGFDLVVMGARGLSRIKEILLGSVTDGVIRNVSCPVLVTK